MAEEIKKKIQIKRSRNYLAKDFDGFRSQLYQYANLYFPDKIQDFTDASVGGMFLDMASFIGDNLSYYLDHQFHETNPNTAVELRNIETHARNAGVKINGASPAVATIEIYIEVPAVLNSDGTYTPDLNTLPAILEGSEFLSDLGVYFYLNHDVDFAQTTPSGNLIATQTTVFDTQNIPQSFILVRQGTCGSGITTTETFPIGDYARYRSISLGNTNVSSIERVVDTEGNDYYEVEALSQDTVYKKIVVPGSEINGLEIIPAPHRFVTETDIATRTKTLIFGAGNAKSLTDDLIPDPSELALPLFGTDTFSDFSIDPSNLLKTRTLGVAPQNTTLTITYRHGGGSFHNVVEESINEITTLKMRFPDQTPSTTADIIRSSVEVTNPLPASGGAAPQTVNEIKLAIPAARSMQNRIVSKEDLLARVYTLPNEFGRVFRAGISKNAFNNLSSVLYVISKDASDMLTQAPDQLKDNLSVYLDNHRIVGDAIDVLDARIINYQVHADIIVVPHENKMDVVSNVISEISSVPSSLIFIFEKIGPLSTGSLQLRILNRVIVIKFFFF